MAMLSLPRADRLRMVLSLLYLIGLAALIACTCGLIFHLPRELTAMFGGIGLGALFISVFELMQRKWPAK